MIPYGFHCKQVGPFNGPSKSSVTRTTQGWFIVKGKRYWDSNRLVQMTSEQVWLWFSINILQNKPMHFADLKFPIEYSCSLMRWFCSTSRIPFFRRKIALNGTSCLLILFFFTTDFRNDSLMSLPYISRNPRSKLANRNWM